MTTDKDAPDWDELIEYDTCFDCGGEGWLHDCGEDTCFCESPEPNLKCDMCKGSGVI